MWKKQEQRELSEKEKSVFRVVCLVFPIVVGFLLIGVGVDLHLQEAEFLKTAIETTGVVIGFEDTRGLFIDTTLRDYGDKVHVSFTVDEVEYSGHWGYRNFNAGMKVGDTLKLYYNPDNPADFQSTNHPALPIVSGLIFLAIGVFVGVCMYMGKRAEKKGLPNTWY